MRVYPDVVFPGFEIRNNGMNVRFATNFSLVVEYDGRWTSVIKIPSAYKTNMMGICADADDDADNDFVLSDGTDVRNSDFKFDEVCNSHQVDDPEDESLVFNMTLIRGSCFTTVGRSFCITVYDNGHCVLFFRTY